MVSLFVWFAYFTLIYHLPFLYQTNKLWTLENIPKLHRLIFGLQISQPYQSYWCNDEKNKIILLMYLKIRNNFRSDRNILQKFSVFLDRLFFLNHATYVCMHVCVYVCWRERGLGFQIKYSVWNSRSFWIIQSSCYFKSTVYVIGFQIDGKKAHTFRLHSNAKINQNTCNSIGNQRKPLNFDLAQVQTYIAQSYMCMNCKIAFSRTAVK